MKVKHTHTFCGILIFLLFVGLFVVTFSYREGYHSGGGRVWLDTNSLMKAEGRDRGYSGYSFQDDGQSRNNMVQWF